MPGELVPLVLLPRFSTFAGQSTFVTIAMDVTEYSAGIVNCWRGKLLGSSPVFTLTFEESSDQVTWATCGGTNVSGYDPGEETEGQANATLVKRWFRVKVILGGTTPAATCWAVGFLEQRLS
jgi:hypothetical protein